MKCKLKIFMLVFFVLFNLLVGCTSADITNLNAGASTTTDDTVSLYVELDTEKQNSIKTKPEVIISDIHTHQYTITTIPSTCNEFGYDEYVCKCGDKYIKQDVEKASHTFSNWSITKHPTFLNSGSEKRSCVVCEFTETRNTGTKKIQNDKTVFLHKSEPLNHYMVYPKEKDFGRYYENAIKLYNGLYNNTSEEVRLVFENETYEQETEDYINFKNVFEEKVLLNRANLVKRWFVTGALEEGCGLTVVEIIPSDTYQLQQISYETLIDAGVQNGDTQLDAIIKINKWIINNIKYVIGNSTAIDTVKNKTAQCAGYADLFMAMCKYAGIEAEYIVGCVDGYSEGGSCYGCHAWNRVKLGGEWYYIDTCWNDNSSKNRYFLSKTLWDKRVNYYYKNFF